MFKKQDSIKYSYGIYNNDLWYVCNLCRNCKSMGFLNVLYHQ